MSKNTPIVGRRAWSILRLALLWARKGGLFRNRLVFSLNVLGKGIRKLRNSNYEQQRGALVYGDREFSFDDTPIIHVKMHRPSSLRFKMPHIPCIKPQVDFDYDFEFDDDNQICYGLDESSNRLINEDEDEIDVNGDFDEEDGIDLKAEQFIAKFYEQMKMQRQISCLQYNENRGTN
ncbi:hypothetical protein ACJIZ3_011596 [Penstemon smallii]|uniref:Cotton fiber protein n=1 Tax=Penstemon smallii TaxID=265156 RepID=A0ABD3UJK6_9LAMI